MTADRACQLGTSEYNTQLAPLLARLPVSSDEIFATHETAFAAAEKKFRDEVNLAPGEAIPRFV